MEVIKRKIAALKDDLENKEELIAELQSNLKNEKLERERAENEASSFKRKVNQESTKCYSIIFLVRFLQEFIVKFVVFIIIKNRN